MGIAGDDVPDPARLFVACYPPSAALEHAENWVSAHLPPNARMTAPARWHITLAFLGEVPRHRLDELQGALAQLPRQRFGPVRIAGARNFGPSVVVLGMTGPDDVLADLARARRACVHACRTAHVRPAPGRWQPHLTVARCRGGGAAGAARALAAYVGTSWWWEDVRLVESRLGPRPQHLALTNLGG